MDADSKGHGSVDWRLRKEPRQLALYVHRSPHRAGGSIEHCKHGIASHVDHTTALPPYAGSEDFARPIQTLHRLLVIERH